MHAHIALASGPAIANAAPHEAPREGAVKQSLKVTRAFVHASLPAHASSWVGHIIAVHEAQGPEPAPAESTADPVSEGASADVSCASEASLSLPASCEPLSCADASFGAAS